MSLNLILMAQYTVIPHNYLHILHIMIFNVMRLLNQLHYRLKNGFNQNQNPFLLK